MVGLGGVLSGPASAVTYGTPVSAPSRTVPWVLSFYQSDDPAGDATLVCTATALSPRVVLTAAHCVQGGGFFFVNVGADRLTGGVLVPVEAVVDHAGYSQRLSVNDVAVMRPLLPLPLSSFPRLGSAALTRQVNGRRPPALTLYGWGLNQNRQLTGKLLSARVKPQPAAARRAFGKLFRPKLQLAAGRYNAAARTYAGACSGDSGGPLVVRVKRVPYVVGVTSWGARGCNVRKPTIFTAVSAYGKWLSRSRGSLLGEAQLNNLAVPEVLTDPSISGTPAVGSPLTCNLGDWTDNAKTYTVSWQYSANEQASVDEEAYVVKPTDAGRSLYCEIEMSSDAGTSTFDTDPVTVPAAPPV
jgi:hypothetical protein